jgi:hypothetical protein
MVVDKIFKDLHGSILGSLIIMQVIHAGTVNEVRIALKQLAQRIHMIGLNEHSEQNLIRF